MKKSFVLYMDQYPPIKGLSLVQKGCLLDSIFKYQSGEKVECIDEVVEMAFSFLKQTFERDNDKYAERCEKNAENARKRWDKNNATASDRIDRNAKHAYSESGSGSEKIVGVKEDSDKNILGETPPEPPKKKRKQFVKPSVEEIRTYCLERNNSIDPENFFDHYEGNGWMRGKNKIKDWKACVRTWERNQKPKPQTLFKSQGQKSNFSNILNKKFTEIKTELENDRPENIDNGTYIP